MKKLVIYNSGKPLKMLIDEVKIQLPDGARIIGKEKGQISKELAEKIVIYYGNKVKIVDTEDEAKSEAKGAAEKKAEDEKEAKVEAGIKAAEKARKEAKAKESKTK